ncbi:hypothetical protein A3862_04440 [Methylobacterium sp. XJLW]|nr:hypothetical protein A3862_04440 [Methylobacterium sp. XJLW]
MEPAQQRGLGHRRPASRYGRAGAQIPEVDGPLRVGGIRIPRRTRKTVAGLNSPDSRIAVVRKGCNTGQRTD